MALRLALLNTQIALRARQIAHEATRTCKGELLPHDDEHHTPKCNKLKHEIEDLARLVKLATHQGEVRREAEPFALSAE
jgi:hypothetical protein